MSKKILPIIGAIIFSIFSFTGEAQVAVDPRPLPMKEKTAVLDSITRGYTPWNRISMSGQLSSPMLPVTASVKIYMERNNVIQMAVAAPFIGEAARIVIDQEKAIVVNRLKNTYSELLMEEVEPIIPGGLTAIQNLLLGRITLLGSGQLNKYDADRVEIYQLSDTTSVLLPNQDLENALFAYFYTLADNPLQLYRFSVMTDNDNEGVHMTYTWDARSYSIEFSTAMGRQPLQATLTMNYPDLTATPLDRLDLNSGFKKVPPSKLMSF